MEVRAPIGLIARLNVASEIMSLKIWSRTYVHSKLAPLLSQRFREDVILFNTRCTLMAGRIAVSISVDFLNVVRNWRAIRLFENIN